MTSAGPWTRRKTESFRHFVLKRWVFPKIMVPPNHSILIGFSIINHPFWGTTIFGNTQVGISLKDSDLQFP